MSEPIYSADELAAMAEALAASDQYRVLRRLRFRNEFAPAGGRPTKTGVLLDVETTGLDTTADEVIELGMVKFAYLPTGEITHVIKPIVPCTSRPSRSLRPSPS